MQTSCIVEQRVLVKCYVLWLLKYMTTLFFQEKLGLSNTEGSFVNGILKCKFRRSKQTGQQPNSELFDLDKDWYLMFGTGPAISGTVLLLILFSLISLFILHGQGRLVVYYGINSLSLMMSLTYCIKSPIKPMVYYCECFWSMVLSTNFRTLVSLRYWNYIYIIEILTKKMLKYFRIKKTRVFLRPLWIWIVDFKLHYLCTFFQLKPWYSYLLIT